MNKKIISSLLVIIMIFGLCTLTGCKNKKDDNINPKQADIPSNIKNNKSTVTVSKEIENTAKIHIVDPVENMWSENLNIDLTKEETEELVRHLSESKGEYEEINWGQEYKLQCIDNSGKIISEFGMSYRMFTDYNGVRYHMSEDMKNFVENLEKKYKLTRTWWQSVRTW